MDGRIKYITDFIKRWEGNGGTDGKDCGWTQYGITLCTYKAFFGKNKTKEDLKKITDEEWFEIFRKGFYDRIKGDSIVNDSICLLVVDFAYNSGVKTAIRQVQKALGCTADGIIGKITLGLLNDDNQSEVFEKIWLQRYYYYNLIAQKPNNKKFLKGWLRRLNAINFSSNRSS